MSLAHWEVTVLSLCPCIIPTPGQAGILTESQVSLVNLQDLLKTKAALRCL